VDIELQGDIQAIDHFTMTYSLEDMTDDAYVWPSEANPEFTLSDLTEQDDGTYRIQNINFPDSYYAEIDGNRVYHTPDGRMFGCTVKAFDAAGNELNSVFDTKTTELYEKGERVTAEVDNDTSTLTIYFNGSTKATNYKFSVQGAADSFEYGANASEISEAAQSDLSNSLYFEQVLSIQFDISGMEDGSASEHEIRVTPSSDSGSTYDSEASEQIDCILARVEAIRHILPKYACPAYLAGGVYGSVTVYPAGRT
jgi:hypothetical protein